MTTRETMILIHDELMEVVKEHGPMDTVAAMGIVIAEIFGCSVELEKDARKILLEAYLDNIRDAVKDVAQSSSHMRNQ